MISQPCFLFMEHENSVLNVFVDTLISPALNILLDQLLELGPKMNSHRVQFTTKIAARNLVGRPPMGAEGGIGPMQKVGTPG
jgi:hypothetical protein